MLSAGAFAQTGVEYLYDELGRLKTVVAPNGERAEYDYDVAGNIIGIRRVGAGVLAISEFTPNVGPAGTVVTIHGAGFSTTPASNTVRFNGTFATVTSATAKQLQVTAPPGGASGPISVTVGSATVTSSESYTYIASAVLGPPTITGFTPDNGTTGTQVTITGTNFDLAPGATGVEFNGKVSAPIVSLTPTQIVVTVPARASSGPIAVVTPRGTAISSGDFIVPPSGYAYADLISRMRVAVDAGAATLNINTANKHGLVLFSGALGQFLSVQISSLTTSPANQSVNYKVFDPNNTQILSGSVSATAMTIHLPRLPKPGTYNLIFSPGNATASLIFRVIADPQIVGPANQLNVATAVSGQSARFVFAGTSSAALTLRFDNMVTVPANSTINLTLYDPNGTFVTQSTGSTQAGGAAMSAASLPADGPYSVVVRPFAGTVSTRVTLNPAMDIVADGLNVNVTTSTPGAARRLLFSGIAGQKIGMGLTGLTTSGGGPVSMNLYKPDGTGLASVSCSPTNPGGACHVNGFVEGGIPTLGALPTTGTYSVVLYPVTTSQTITGGTITLSNDVLQTLSAGTWSNLNLTRAGQNARLTFSGTGGQSATLIFRDLVTAPVNVGAEFKVYRANGARIAVAAGSSSNDGVHLYIPSLPATETYTVFVDPFYGATAVMNATVNPTSSMADIVADGPSVDVTTSTPGYGRRLLFSGTAGQKLGLGLSGQATSPAGGVPFLWVYRPDGVLMTSGNCSATEGCQVDLFDFMAGSTQQQGLPSSGIYTVVVQATQRITAGALTLSNDLTVPLAAGTPFDLNLPRAGQNARLTFSGTVGQAVTLAFDNVVTTPANKAVDVRLYRADGTQLAAITRSSSSDPIPIYIASLPATETYTLLVNPPHATTMTAKVTLNPAMDVAIDGSPASITTSTPGAPRRLLFNGTAGQKLGLGLSAVALAPTSGTVLLNVYRPEGTGLAGGVCHLGPGGGCSMNLFSAFTGGLPSSGPYTVVLRPAVGQTITNGTLTLSNDVTATLSSGTPFNLNLPRAGQNARLSFAGTAGQAVLLTFDDVVTTPANQQVWLTLYRATGASIATAVASAATDGEQIYAASLPATETYTVFVDPPTPLTMKVARDPTAMDIAVNGPSVNMAAGAPNYQIRLRFSGTAGQKLGLGLSGLTTSMNNPINVYVWGPGMSVPGTSCGPTQPGGACNVNVFSSVMQGLPSTGTYTILLSPSFQDTITSGAVTLSTDVTGTLAVGGAPLSVSTSRSGQNARYTFSGSAGQTLRLNGTSLATTPSGQPVALQILRPDGTVLGSVSSAGPSFSYDIPALPSTGSYTVFIDPAYGATTTMNLSISTR